jgi:hypothetical protein
MHDVVVVGAGPSARRSRWRSPKPTSTSSRSTRARAARRARRPLARAVARRAPAVRAARRVGALAHAGAVTPITAIDISQAGGFGTCASTRASTTCRRSATSSPIARCRRALDAALRARASPCASARASRASRHAAVAP